MRLAKEPLQLVPAGSPKSIVLAAIISNVVVLVCSIPLSFSEAAGTPRAAGLARVYDGPRSRLWARGAAPRDPDNRARDLLLAAWLRREARTSRARRGTPLWDPYAGRRSSISNFNARRPNLPALDHEDAEALGRKQSPRGAGLIKEKFINVGHWASEVPEFEVPSLDRDHRQLVDLIRRVQLPGFDAAPDQARAAVDDLAHHFAYHFGREEMLMRLTGYPDAEQHRQSHAALTARLGEFRSLLRRGMFPHDRFRDFVAGPLLLHLHDKDARLQSWAAGFGASAAA